nr:DoxX family protein [Myxacorys almedinensis]
MVVRVSVGLLMIHNGFSKLADVQGFADSVVKLIGLPYPVFFTYCAAYTEIGGSVLLALGLFTRLDAVALLFTMSIAVYFHLKGEGLHIAPIETASLYALFYLLFAVRGGGVFSIDTALAKWLTRPAQ